MKNEILESVERNKDILLVTIIAPIDLIIMGLIIKYGINYDFVWQIEANNFTHQTFILQQEHLASISKAPTLTINSQLVNRLLLIKSITFNLLLIQIIRYMDNEI